jgi:hypothetical protein
MNLFHPTLISRLTLLMTIASVSGCGARPAPDTPAPPPPAQDEKAAGESLPTLSPVTKAVLLHAARVELGGAAETSGSFMTDPKSAPLVARLRAHPEYGQAYELLADMLETGAMRRFEKVFVDLTPEEAQDVVAWYSGKHYPDTPGLMQQKRFSAMYRIHIQEPLKQASAARD